MGLRVLPLSRFLAFLLTPAGISDISKVSIIVLQRYQFMSILRHRYLISLLVFLAVILGNGTASAHPARDSYDRTKKKWESLQSSAKKKKYRDQWFKVIDHFEKIAKRYPDRPEAPKSLYNIGHLYTDMYRYSYLREDLTSAIEAYTRLGEKYPRNRLADDAWYLAAEIYREKLSDPATAYQFYDRAVNEHPKGDMCKKARYWHARLEPEYGRKKEPPPPATEQEAGGAESATPALVRGIRYWSGPEYTRVVVDLSDRVQYEPHLIRYDPELEKPPRLYLDIAPGKMSPELSQPISIKDGLLNRARTSQYRKDIVRVVLDINSYENYYHFHLENPFRIVVDIHGQASPVKTATASNAYGDTIESILDTNGGTEATSPPRPPITLARQFQLKVKRIVIDPGHGGKDPGAVGPTGLYEKDVNLTVSRLLRDNLQAKGYEVVMTRDTDVFVDLLERSAIANKNKADLFISVHANASPRRSARGIETYYLSPTTDPETMRLAAFENAMTTQSQSDLEFILRDLLLSSKIEESSIFAASVQKSIVSGLRGSYREIIDHGVKPGPFFVLVNTSMPAVLVEMSFVSNYKEEERLRDPAYLRSIADSITRGVEEYIQSYLMVANW